MAEPALMPPPVAPEPDIRAQAREWARKKIVSSEFIVMEDEIERADRVSGKRPDACYDFDDDDFFGGVWGEPIKAECAFGFIREAANRYPFPLTEPVLEAAIRRLRPHIRTYQYNDEIVEGVDGEPVIDIIKDILENPDALLD